MMAMLQQKRPKPLRRLGFGPTRQEAPGGFEPPITDLQSDHTYPESQGKPHVSTSCQQIASSKRKNDPDLQAVIDAWPALPDLVKADIVATVKAAK